MPEQPGQHEVPEEAAPADGHTGCEGSAQDCIVDSSSINRMQEVVQEKPLEMQPAVQQEEAVISETALAASPCQASVVCQFGINKH
jgi:hypothetical protein